MAASAVASLGRVTTTLHRLPLRLSPSSASSSSILFHLPSRTPIPRLRTTTQMRIRRESLALSSMCPGHSSIASARLVAKLPTETSACVEVDNVTGISSHVQSHVKIIGQQISW